MSCTLTWYKSRDVVGGVLVGKRAQVLRQARVAAKEAGCFVFSCRIE